MQTGTLLDVDFHPDIGTPMEHKAFLSTEHSQDLSCTNSPGRTSSGDVCGDSVAKETNVQYTKAWELRYENNVCFRRVMHPVSLVSDVVSDDTTYVDGENISNQDTIEDFTEEVDEPRFVRQYNSSQLRMKKLFLCLSLMNLLLGVVLHSSSLVTIR